MESPAKMRQELIEEIVSLPAPVGQAFRESAPEVERRLGEEAFRAWMAEGLGIARSSFRAWEAAVDFFRATPEALSHLEAAELAAWAAGGRDLSIISATLSGAYFRASPRVLGQVSIADLSAWTQAGRRLYHGTWKSGALAGRFFEITPRLLQHISLSDLGEFSAFLDSLAQRSSELAEECLAIADECFSYVDAETVAGYLNLLNATATHNWKYAKEAQRAGAVALPRLARGERERMLGFASTMAQDKGKRYLSFLSDGSRALNDLDFPLHHPILNMFEVLLALSQEAAVEFLRSTPPVLGRVDINSLHRWYGEGVRILEQNEAAGISFFKLESARGEYMLQELSATVALETIGPMLQLYARALTGEDLQLKPTPDLAKKTIGWAAEDRASTDGSHIFLPEEVALFPTKNENFHWYKVLCTHQAGHLEFRSFDFAFDRPGNVFPTARTKRPVQAWGERPPGVGYLSEFEHFFDVFSDRRLASDIFAAVEDARVDHLVRTSYAGLRAAYGVVQIASVEGRPVPQSLPLREALVELLVRMTLLDSPATIPVPQPLQRTVRSVARVLRRLRNRDAAVEDAAEATLRIYDLLSKVPNQLADEMEWTEQDVGDLGEGGTESSSEIGEADSASEGGNEFVPGQGTPQDVPYHPPKEVDYRGDFKPELVQTIANLRKGKQQADGTTQGTPLTEEMIRQLLEKSAEIDLSSVVQGDIDDPSGLFISSLMSEAIEGPDAPWDDQQGNATPSSKKRRGESEESLSEEAHSYLYDEWDFKALDYKPRWCRVKELQITEGSSDFFHQTVERHAGLVNEVRRQFEMIVPETYRKQKRLQDGEEYDLDAVIEAVLEKKAGAAPDDKLYWRRNKVERDVAVIFLLDMSASTAEAIDEKTKEEDDTDIPDDPRQYLFWLRTRRDQAKRSYRRIIDIEKESTVLLIRALETIGDTYGIYGFSGYGRENVEYYVIKGIEEPFTETVQRRIDGITPLHATRMGPAIRHATAKLDGLQAKTKVLFLISDGRPQDRGYSREGVEKEYAVQDTHMALLEAKARGIVPFCLTVDRAGHDYMKEMCGDLPYEVLADITMLPKRLPQLYRRLTI